MERSWLLLTVLVVVCSRPGLVTASSPAQFLLTHTGQYLAVGLQSGLVRGLAAPGHKSVLAAVCRSLPLQLLGIVALSLKESYTSKIRYCKDDMFS